MSADGQRQSLEVQKRANVAQIETQRVSQVNSLRAAAKEQKSSVESAAVENTNKLLENKSALEAQIGNLENILRDLPPGHPQGSELQKRLNSMRKSLSFVNNQLASIQFRVKSQKQMINFQGKMREEMMEIRFKTQKSLVLRRFAELFMQLQANQERMASVQSAYATSTGSRKPAEAKESGTQKG